MHQLLSKKKNTVPQQEIATGQNLINIIMNDHAAYQALPQTPTRDMFEDDLSVFIDLQNATCGAYSILNRVM